MIEAGKLRSAGGATRVAGVELGGTKCVAVLSRDGTQIDEQVTVPTSDPVATLSALAGVLDGWWRSEQFQALGIASFGPIALDPNFPEYGRITTTSKPGWQGADVLGALAAPFPVPSAFDTDVNGAALAEGRWGDARGLDDYAYVTVGTGVGVGLIVAGRPTRGFGHCELGHVGVPRLPGADWPGNCPFHGSCVEGLASGSAIGARMARLGWDQSPAPDHMFWDEPADALAQLCQMLVLSTAPRRILIGGGVTNGQPHLLDKVEARLRQILAGYVDLPAPTGAYVTGPGLGDLAGPMGPIAMALTLCEHHAAS
ncbi:ROK family protein [Sphingomonas aerophila]|jgi:fructokinase|nr:ROK family protein [Sphingomonas aerophila]